MARACASPVLDRDALDPARQVTDSIRKYDCQA